MEELVLTLKGSRPWSKEEETTACKIKVKSGMTKEEFIYKLQDMFVVVLENENSMMDKDDE